MQTHPFLLLRPSARALRTTLFAKDDAPLTDERVRQAMGGKHVAALWQVHGGHTVVTREGIARNVKADAVATDAPGLVLTIRTADCQSFLVYEPHRHVVALIHAGWRGLLAGIIPSTFDLLWEEWAILPEDVYVGAGPALCLACSGFTDPHTELKGIDAAFFHGTNADLRGIAEDQLWKLGVREERFERIQECTKCQNDRYWSYRGSDRAAVQGGSTNILAAVLEPR